MPTFPPSPPPALPPSPLEFLPSCLPPSCLAHRRPSSAPPDMAVNAEDEQIAHERQRRERFEALDRNRLEARQVEARARHAVDVVAEAPRVEPEVAPRRRLGGRPAAPRAHRRDRVEAEDEVRPRHLARPIEVIPVR